MAKDAWGTTREIFTKESGLMIKKKVMEFRGREMETSMKEIGNKANSTEKESWKSRMAILTKGSGKKAIWKVSEFRSERMAISIKENSKIIWEIVLGFASTQMGQCMKACGKWDKRVLQASLFMPTETMWIIFNDNWYG